MTLRTNNVAIATRERERERVIHAQTYFIILHFLAMTMSARHCERAKRAWQNKAKPKFL